MNRPFKKDESDFIDCVAWRKTAEYIANYGTKGRLLEVEGRGQSRTYEAKDGGKRKVTELVVDQASFLGKGDSGAEASSKGSGDRNYDTGAWIGQNAGTKDPWEDLGREVNMAEIDGAISIDEEEIPF